MDTQIGIAIISGLCVAIPSILATVITSQKDNALQSERISVLQSDINKLSAKVEQHNNFGVQLAKLETRVANLEKQ